ncbi:LysM peptidoglycan-binding domain-containing protein [Fodinicola acaciae]|uniref:LysM peptidoglycan-binding domain-containing protein n=1 Tax=Fodinicola acaciae TaxID=2681555 RepID=UPI001C9E6262|nr:LysM peptidoglycan-binding domain-containing protein [Fodinicola acaciae]
MATGIGTATLAGRAGLRTSLCAAERRGASTAAGDTAGMEEDLMGSGKTLAPVIELYPDRPVEERELLTAEEWRIRQQTMMRHPAGKNRTVVPMRQRRSTLRLTRRGRIVLVVLLVLAAAGIAFWSARAMAAPERPAQSVVSVVVQPGQSLWSIAEAYDPSRNPRDVIRDIQRLNDLDGTTLLPGHRLVMPSHAT